MAGEAGINSAFSQNLAAQRLAREILVAYPQGAFPMAESADSADYEWYRPHERGIIPIGGFHASRSLRRFARRHQGKLKLVYNHDFGAVIDACAAREETWINPTIRAAFLLLHELNLAHSVAVFQNGDLIGGVYGLALGGAFMGESMFSHAPNGSKLALWALLADLERRRFSLFDTQFLTPHLESLGGVEISNAAYLAALTDALEQSPAPISKGEIKDWQRLLIASP